LLHHLNGEASPKALGDLRDRTDLPCRIEDAFAPEPVIPPATDILFDAWALTSITQPMPGRPPVEPYLHGIAEWQPPETQVAWREEVEIITGDLLDLYPPEDLLDDYRLLPHELLRDRSDRVFKQLETLAQQHPDKPAWLTDERGAVQPTTLGKLADKERKTQIESKTILLPPSVGGLTKDGMLDGNSQQARDVADAAVDEGGRPRRQRVWDEVPPPEGLRIIRTIDTRPGADETDSEEGDGRRRLWHWCDQPHEGGRTANKSVTWDRHVGDAVDHAKRIVAGLPLPDGIADAVILAAKLHDHGKKRERFQLTLGNREYPHVVLAKSNGRAAARWSERSRHEFASVLDAGGDPEFAKLGAEMQDLVLHLIGAHHGRARPHFNPEEAFDPERPSGDAENLSLETPRRFARLQRKYGRWGLAYLESLLRAADWAASAAEAEGCR
jgi:CRISPR-associated endonuclease/helicase Cas3